MSKLLYKLKSGKNSKFLYFTKNYLSLLIPSFLYRKKRVDTLRACESRSDWEYMKERIAYYNKLSSVQKLPADCPTLSEHKLGSKKVYFFDTYEFTRWFESSLRWSFLPGDITYIPDAPSILKSRPIAGDNHNSVLMKLNKVRHYIFVEDEKSFSEKKNMAIFRGKVAGKEGRELFMERYFGHPMFDLGDIGKRARAEWKTEKKTIKEHLDYKFIMAIEGNDVASNLKWVMSSNSVAVMPRPTYETWFMEGRLIPNYHYIEVKPDFSDVEERLNYYIQHPEEAEEIIRNAHAYVDQFRDEEREKLISLHVLDKYFKYVK